MPTPHGRSLVFLVLLVASVGVACGGGGPAGAGAEAVTEATGSEPTVLPPDDPGAPSSSDESPASVPPAVPTVTAMTAELALTLTITNPAPFPPNPQMGAPSFLSPQPISFDLELRNISGQPLTIVMTDQPFHVIDGWHQATGDHIWAKIALWVPPYPVAFAVDEKKSFQTIWFPAGYAKGLYTFEGKIATADARVPGPVQLAIELK